MAIRAGPGSPVEGVSGLPAPNGPATSVSESKASAVPRRALVRRFFVAVFLSLYGDWLTTVALLVVLFQLTGNPAAPAGYMLVRVAPRVLGPVWGGRLADRFSPRTVIVTTSALQAAVALLLIAAHRAGSVWAIYAVVAVAQFTGSLGKPSLGALLPTLVSESSLARANATYGLFLSTSIFVAPAIGALLLTRLGPDPLFAIDAATFAVSATLVATLGRQLGRDRDLLGVRTRERGNGAVSMALRQPEIRMVAVANFASAMTVTVTQALLVVAAHERFSGDAAVGYLYSGVGIGGALGGLVALRWIPPRRWTRLAMFVATVLDVVGLAFFSASTAAVAALLTLAASAVAGSSLDVWGVTEVQRRAPSGLMGRYNSVIFISMYSGMLAGALWALGTAGLLHWDKAIEFACAAMLVLVGSVWLMGGSRSAAAPTQEP
ncbi:MAG: MFS transporter [Candidatus Dormibacteraeota bacterium]|nr:MFS transporter [Candidatus Dormibacteraeota bacterium]